MKVQLNIDFAQLVQLVKSLNPGLLKKLQAEIDIQAERKNHRTDLEEVLLNGPVATKAQIEVIAANRKAVNQWRTH